MSINHVERNFRIQIWCSYKWGQHATTQAHHIKSVIDKFL